MLEFGAEKGYWRIKQNRWFMLKKPQLTNMGFKEGFLKATCEVMAVGWVHAILLIGWW